MIFSYDGRRKHINKSKTKAGHVTKKKKRNEGHANANNKITLLRKGIVTGGEISSWGNGKRSMEDATKDPLYCDLVILNNVHYSNGGVRHEKIRMGEK